MGNLNCSQFCQGSEGGHELDLKQSIARISIQNRKSIKNLQNAAPTQDPPPFHHSLQEPEPSNTASSDLKSFVDGLEQQREEAALRIQQAFRIFYNIRQYLQFKNYRKLNHNYFSSDYIKETVSPANGLLKRKKRKIYTYLDGSTYEGEWKGGFRDGYGIMVWNDGSQYQGEWSYGYPFGEGIFHYKREDVYEGEWRCLYSFDLNKKNAATDGYAWLYKKCKEAKEGPRYSEEHLEKLRKLEKDFGDVIEILEQHKANTENIFDTQLTAKLKEHTFPGKIKYYGEMKGKIREGRGRNIWENGDLYAGFWSNDKQNGIGRNLWVDGSTYIGEYKDNLKEGVGEYCWIDGSKYTGQWKDNVFHGVGKFVWADGREYYGEWSVGKRTGFGIYTWADGKKYAGGWLDGKKHGIGYSTDENGKITKANYSNGKTIK
ncbi:unnamed protein product [Blepharisma stoltei]|uniref:MORN repeat protein n=1 Tax=Blepharisma stoltei TaxID=1481888 RepID=A0AAU9IZ64_9CILI|nr:unnamed protein product [Blepharisma stoltei]